MHLYNLVPADLLVHTELKYNDLVTINLASGEIHLKLATITRRYIFSLIMKCSERKPL